MQCNEPLNAHPLSNLTNDQRYKVMTSLGSSVDSNVGGT